jgi:hypothetical protein
MSDVNQNLENNMLTSNYDVSKIFVWDNRYDSAEFTNSSGSEVTLEAGLVLGRIAATGKVVELDPAGSDGSQFPVGILAQSATVANGATVKLTYCVAGDVAEDKVILAYGVDLSDVVSGKTIYDRIGSDTVGIKLVGGFENTNFDNQ